jgi:hypothetical protein
LILGRAGDAHRAAPRPGFDLKPLPGRPGACGYGMLPADLYAKLKASILQRQKTLAVRATLRD